ncbi:cohesin domain-containing protein [Thermodesulfobacteriota bacterium]
MNRILLKFINVILFLSVFTTYWGSTAFGVDLFIPAVEVKTGQTIDIPIMLDQVDNLAGVKLVMKYDPNILIFKKATKTEHTSSLMHIANDKKPGLLIVVMAGPRGIKGKDFSILSLTFDTKKDLKSNHTTNIKITEVQLMSDQLKELTCNIKTDPIKILPEKTTETDVKETQ